MASGTMNIPGIAGELARSSAQDLQHQGSLPPHITATPMWNRAGGVLAYILSCQLLASISRLERKSPPCIMYEIDLEYDNEHQDRQDRIMGPSS